jgi:hypothetical protein
MTVTTRRAFCAVMEYRVVDKAGTVLQNDGDTVDTWTVILHGLVERQLPDGSTEELRDRCYSIHKVQIGVSCLVLIIITNTLLYLLKLAWLPSSG